MLGAASEFDLVHLAKEMKGLLQNRFKYLLLLLGLPMALEVKNSPANARDPGDMGLIPGSGRSVFRLCCAACRILVP